MRSLRCVPVFALISLLFLPSMHMAGQNQAPAEHSVKLQIRLNWAEQPKEDTHREVTVTLRRLDEQGQPANFTVRDNALTVVTLNAGRYELTTTKPVYISGRWYGWDVELPVTQAVNDVVLDQQNAVVVSGPDVPGAGADGQTQTAQASGTVDDATQKSIADIVERWKKSLQSRDLDQHMSLYAPELTNFNGKQDVTRQEVMRDRRRFLKEYPELAQISISDLRITDAQGRPQATFLKSWSFGGNTDWQGQERTWLTFQKERGRWVITSERDRLVKESVPFAAGDTTPEQ